VSKLTPFVPSLHTHEHAAKITAQPDLHRWYSTQLSSLDQILTEVELRATQPHWILFTVIDKVHGDALAGVIGLSEASAHDLSVEIVWVAVFPAF
jgi:hypothetical protein